MAFDLRFKLVFKRGPKVVAEVEGVRPVAPSEITLAELQDKVIETEAFIEKMTGLRCHIEQIA